MQAAENNELSEWTQTSTGLLALVILLDQFSRNLYRGTARAYQNDARALNNAEQLIGSNEHLQLNVPAQIMLFHPLHHSEDIETQTRAITLFEQLLVTSDVQWHEIVVNNLSYAKNHHKIIEQFGRFPHRNMLLNRKSTQQERMFLENDKRSYGQAH